MVSLNMPTASPGTLACPFATIGFFPHHVCTPMSTATPAVLTLCPRPHLQEASLAQLPPGPVWLLASFPM